MTNNTSMDPVSTAPSNRRPFFLVLALFFAPLLVAFAVYYGSGWRPSGTTNKGDLISPAVPLPEVTLNTLDGASTNAQFLREKWTLVFINDGTCAEVCRSALLGLQQSHQLLGKDMTRVQRAYLFANGGDQQFAAQQTDLQIVSLDSAAGAELLNKFPDINGVTALKAGRSYIVDPLGNLMMSYPPGVDPRSIYQDMKKLLNLSHIG